MDNKVLNITDNQKEQYKEALQNIRANVSSQDRKEAAGIFGTSKETISRYLNGEVRNVVLADNLLSFFTSRIEARNNNLQKALTA